MKMQFFIPCDAGALAVGAEEVADAVHKAAHARKLEAEIVRTGSRGLYWLEPMVEVATVSGRIAYGPVAQDRAESIVDAALTGATHPLRLWATGRNSWV